MNMTAVISSQAVTAWDNILAEKIKTKTARVGVIGLGYVGLPLAVEYAKQGFTVVGIDVQESKTEKLTAGESYVKDVPGSEVRELVLRWFMSSLANPV